MVTPLQVLDRISFRTNLNHSVKMFWILFEANRLKKNPTQSDNFEYSFQSDSIRAKNDLD